MRINKERKNLFLGVLTLTVLFSVFKLLNITDWSWFWVSSPLWISGWLIIIAFLFKQVFLK